MRFAVLLLFICPVFLTAQTDSSSIGQVLEAYQKINNGSDEGGEDDNPWGITTSQEVTARIEKLQTLIGLLPPAATLPEGQQADRELLRFVLNDDLYRLNFNTGLFPFDSEGGPLATIIYRTGDWRIDKEEDAETYRQELRALPAFLRHLQDQLTRGLVEKKTNPRLVIDRVIGLIDRSMLAEPAESFFLSPTEAYPAARESIASVVKEEVQPAFRELRRFLQDDYLPNLPEAIGISSIAGGQEYYRHLIRYYTTDEAATPEEVFATGLREVARIKAEMEAVIARTGFEGSFAEFFDFLRTDPQFYAQSPAALLERAAWITKRMEAKLPEYFDRLPRMPLTVAPVPAALAPTYTGGRYSPGSYADRRAGAFWVNTYDLPSRPLYTLPALALHEGVPGHHTQMMLAAELEGRSDFRRNLYLSAFGEGWALYAEFLGKEAGIYQGDYEEFGRLTYEMWRACRLVVDPGIHYFHWTRDSALVYMAENTALSIHEVTTEIDRYIGWPGQAVSYKMGELKIRQLRALCESELGEDFDLPAFHNLVLDEGTMTMGMLETRVEAWMERLRKP